MGRHLYIHWLQLDKSEKYCHLVADKVIKGARNPSTLVNHFCFHPSIHPSISLSTHFFSLFWISPYRILVVDGRCTQLGVIASFVFRLGFKCVKPVTFSYLIFADWWA
ncbi:hypothetical protein LY76DRAFT_406103 [Colletotrichum caudatum]|nr:hypothetical protein LY76DRAFT_406103 [Colletotrichum caudatum]